MVILKRIAPVIALLAILMMVQPPIAQSMILKEKTSQSVTHKKIVYSKHPLSTNTKPAKIRSAVYRAWKNKEFKWNSESEWKCLDQIIKHESSWNPWADNGMGWEETGGIPQSHPSRKMAEAGKDYRTNVWTQVRWGLNYIRSAYGTPCNAWDAWQNRAGNGSYGWY